MWLLVPIVFLASCSENPCRCVSPDEPACRDWPVLADSMNLAVLVLDYLTYTFEGGNLAYYEPCDGCDSDSLPFTVDFKPTWDFASILFTYKATGDTLFWAEIIWHGGGQILYPVAFTPADSFCTLSDSIAEPADPERFQFYPTLPPEELITKTDSTWAAVSTLDIVHAFAEGDFKVAYYFYPPAVGAFNPAVAKWIVFLYRGRTVVPSPMM